MFGFPCEFRDGHAIHAAVTTDSRNVAIAVAGFILDYTVFQQPQFAPLRAEFQDEIFQLLDSDSTELLAVCFFGIKF
jgi:hypothetical protein